MCSNTKKNSVSFFQIISNNNCIMTTNIEVGRLLNYKRQTEDERDIKYPTILHKDINTIRVFSLEKTRIRIYDQGKIGSCVSNAVAGCINYYNNTVNPSRLYIYFNGRAMNKDIKNDTGLQVRDGCKSVFNYSVCNENDWIYEGSGYHFQIMPPLKCYITSFKFNNFIYYSIPQDLALLKTCLLSNNPIIFGFIVYTSFMSIDVEQTGRVPMPTETDYIAGENIEHRVSGGHCSLIVGYNDDEQVFICVNSWGEIWGDKGYFYIPYQYILDPLLAFDFTVINFNSPIQLTSTKVKSNLKMQFI